MQQESREKAIPSSYSESVCKGCYRPCKSNPYHAYKELKGFERLLLDSFSLGTYVTTLGQFENFCHLKLAEQKDKW